MTDAKDHAGAQIRFAHADIADVHAIARIEIAQAVAVIARRDFEVGARYGFVVDDEIADDAATAGDTRLDDVDLAARIGACDYDQLALAQLAHGRPLTLEHRGEAAIFE